MTVASPAAGLDTLVFDNRFTRELPADPSSRNVPRQAPGACYSRVEPTTVRAPSLVAYSREMAAELGFDEAICRSRQFADVFAGNRRLLGSDPHASRYGGHQFGVWAGQLGDGRAINLGEVVVDDDRRWTLQLKGAGLTPYSRTADGLAVLRSSVREFLCSEAMFHLGVPTTRALSLVTTGEDVLRDMFYDGSPKNEPGAVVCRVARSFTRFGSFEILAADRDHELLRRLLDFTIATDFGHLGPPSVDTYLEWYREVGRRTVEMVVHWARVGFVHGVMNTDNMSVLGLTIDYGPYGWLEDFDPDWTPNTTDAGRRRYRFGAQASIALWNLSRLATAILPLVGEAAPLQEILEETASLHDRRWRSMLASKLGLGKLDGDEDRALVDELFDLLRLVETDMTLFFRALSRLVHRSRAASGGTEAPSSSFVDSYYRPEQLDDAYEARLGAWLDLYEARGSHEEADGERRSREMDRVNPKYVLRNYLAQLAIDRAEEGDASMVETLLEVLRRPYHEQREHEDLAARRPDWARNRPGCSMLSCSS